MYDGGIEFAQFVPADAGGDILDGVLAVHIVAGREFVLSPLQPPGSVFAQGDIGRDALRARRGEGHLQLGFVFVCVYDDFPFHLFLRQSCWRPPRCGVDIQLAAAFVLHLHLYSVAGTGFRHSFCDCCHIGSSVILLLQALGNNKGSQRSAAKSSNIFAFA